VSADRPRPLTTEEVGHLLRAKLVEGLMNTDLDKSCEHDLGNSQRFNEPH